MMSNIYMINDPEPLEDDEYALLEGALRKESKDAAEEVFGPLSEEQFNALGSIASFYHEDMEAACKDAEYDIEEYDWPDSTYEVLKEYLEYRYRKAGRKGDEKGKTTKEE